MLSSRDGGFGLPSPRRCSMGASLAPITTMPWMENAPAVQVMRAVPPWTAVPQPETDPPSEQHHTHHGGSRSRLVLINPPLSKGQHHGEANSLASKPLS
jgi:hypothetical protein